VFAGILTRLPLRLTSTLYGHLRLLFKAAKGSEMKIKKIKNHGIIRWRVNDPRGINGKRQRKFFETKEAAERFTRQKDADRKAKTRRRRLIPIPTQLRAWLDCSREIGGKLPAVNYADKFKRTLENAGLRAEWQQNALRHSFASNHYAKSRNENETAALMGDSPQLLFKHYRELVRPTDAEAFFRFMPPPDALARARCRRVPER
jgi:hypothetical protein